MSVRGASTSTGRSPTLTDASGGSTRTRRVTSMGRSSSSARCAVRRCRREG
ncbi:MAG: hypothetical protein R3A52_06590 [Polyangiales bacterium]